MTPLRLIGLAALLAPNSSFAQSREPFEVEPSGPLLRADVAGSRQPSGTEAIGVQVGSALVRPTATVRAEADSNVLNRSSDERGDVFVVLAPAVTATLDSGRSTVVLRAEAAVARFASLNSQNSETFALEANGSLKISRNTALFARLSYDHKVEPRASAGGAQIEGSPAEYTQLEAQLAARTEIDDLRLTLSVSGNRRSYEDIHTSAGIIADQSFRDAETLAVAMKAEYAIPAGAVLFAQGFYSWTDSINPNPCCDRSASGGHLLGGFRADLTNLISAEAAVGYMVRTYDSAIYKDYKGLIWRGRLQWYPTPLVSLSLASDRQIANSSLPSVSGVVVDTITFQTFYEMRRNLNLIATLSRTSENYREAQTTTRGTVVGIEARYVSSPLLTTGIFARYRTRESSGTLPLRGGDGVEGGMWIRVSI